MYVDLHSQVLSGEYDVIQTGRGGQQRRGPSGNSFTAQDYQRIYGTKPPPTDDRKHPLKALAPFIAGTITGFGIGSALKMVGITSGLVRSAISLGVSSIGWKIGSKTAGAPGTFGWGVALGGALFSSYEGWKLLADIGDEFDKLKYLGAEVSKFYQRSTGLNFGGFQIEAWNPSPNTIIWNYGSITYTP